jgi:hypothetical protein
MYHDFQNYNTVFILKSTFLKILNQIFISLNISITYSVQYGS